MPLDHIKAVADKANALVVRLSVPLTNQATYEAPFDCTHQGRLLARCLHGREL